MEVSWGQKSIGQSMASHTLKLEEWEKDANGYKERE